MNTDDRDIDRLLQVNVDRQLADIDWDRFSDDISKRLATVGLRRRVRSRYLGPLAVAAGLVLAAGVLVVVLIGRREPATTTSNTPGRATVSFQEPVHGAGTATVVLSGGRIARCEVTLIDSARPGADRQTPSSWCVVASRGVPVHESESRSGRTNIACLF